MAKKSLFLIILILAGLVLGFIYWHGVSKQKKEIRISPSVDSSKPIEIKSRGAIETLSPVPVKISVPTPIIVPAAVSPGSKGESILPAAAVSPGPKGKALPAGGNQ